MKSVKLLLTILYVITMTFYYSYLNSTSLDYSSSNDVDKTLDPPTHGVTILSNVDKTLDPPTHGIV